MSRYRISIHIAPRRGILDPQGQAVAGALHALGFSAVREVHVGRYVVVELDADSVQDARELAHEMCDRLLANPVTEDYAIADTEET